MSGREHITIRTSDTLCRGMNINFLPKIDLEKSQVLTIGVVALSIMQKDHNHQSLRQSPWLVVDTVADTAVTENAVTETTTPVKFFRFINSFFDG